MDGTVILEEHFATPATLGDSHLFGAHVWDTLGPRLTDIHGERLRHMDEAGVALMILSLNAPAVQAIPDIAKAIGVAREANDILAEAIAKRPDRFAGFAALPMQDPEAAAQELERCVKDFGFVGALVNGFSQVGIADSAVYYDLPQYRPFWATVERLDVPFYLHPRNPLPSQVPNYEGHTWMMGPSWGFGAETAVHALRLIGSGLFDAHPRLKIILGHLGEGLPYSLWRIDHRNEWMQARHKYAAQKWVADYVRANFHFTTSGNFSSPALNCAIAEMGVERILFSADYPFEDIAQSVAWLRETPLGEADRQKIGRSNALRLFRLKG